MSFKSTDLRRPIYINRALKFELEKILSFHLKFRLSLKFDCSVKSNPTGES